MSSPGVKGDPVQKSSIVMVSDIVPHDRPASARLGHYLLLDGDVVFWVVQVHQQDIKHQSGVRGNLSTWRPEKTRSEAKRLPQDRPPLQKHYLSLFLHRLWRVGWWYSWSHPHTSPAGPHPCPLSASPHPQGSCGSASWCSYAGLIQSQSQTHNTPGWCSTDTELFF